MKKKIFKIIGISFAFLFLVIGSGVGLYVMKQTPKTNSPYLEENVVPDGALFAPNDNSAMQLKVSRGKRNAGAGENNMQYTVSAIVQPSNCVVDWTLSWKDSTGWASDKTLSDYVKLTTNGLSATVTVNKAFGKQVILTCSVIENPSVKATCTIDYYKRILSVSATYSADGGSYCPDCDNDCTISNGGTFNNLRMGSDLEWEDAVSYEFVYSDYTLDVSYAVSSLKLSSTADLLQALSHYNWVSIDSTPSVDPYFFSMYVPESSMGLGLIYDCLYDDDNQEPSNNEKLAFYNANKNLIFATGQIVFKGLIPLIDEEVEYIFNFNCQFAGTDRVVDSVYLDKDSLIV